MNSSARVYIKDPASERVYSPRRVALNSKNSLQWTRLQNHRLSQQLAISIQKNKQNQVKLKELQIQVRDEEIRLKITKDENAALRQQYKHTGLVDYIGDEEVQSRILNLLQEIDVLAQSNKNIEIQNKKKDSLLHRLHNLKYRNNSVDYSDSNRSIGQSRMLKSSSTNQLRNSMTSSAYQTATAGLYTKAQTKLKPVSSARNLTQYATLYSSTSWVQKERYPHIPSVGDIQEIKSLSSPPRLMLQVMRCICLLFGVEPDIIKKVESESTYSWRVCQRTLNNPKRFYQMMQEFNVDDTPQRVISSIESNLLSQEGCTVEIAKSVSKPLASMLGYLIHVVRQYRKLKY